MLIKGRALLELSCQSCKLGASSGGSFSILRLGRSEFFKRSLQGVFCGPQSFAKVCTICFFGNLGNKKAKKVPRSMKYFLVCNYTKLYHATQNLLYTRRKKLIRKGKHHFLGVIHRMDSQNRL